MLDTVPHPAVQALSSSAKYPQPEQVTFIARQNPSKRRSSTYQIEASNDLLKVRLTMNGAGYACMKTSSENMSLHGNRAAKANGYHDVILANNFDPLTINTGLGIDHTERDLSASDVMKALFLSIDKVTHAYCAGGYDGWLLQTKHHLQHLARKYQKSLEMTTLLPMPRAIGTMGIRSVPEHEVHIVNADETIDPLTLQEDERQAQTQIDRQCRPTGCRLKLVLPITMMRQPYSETITVSP